MRSLFIIFAGSGLGGIGRHLVNLWVTFSMAIYVTGSVTLSIVALMVGMALTRHI